MMDKGKNDKNPYVSCIKINGVPILPPLISPNKRKELLKYKEQAIEIENNLICKRENEVMNNDNPLPVGNDYVPYKNLKQRTRHLSLDIVDVTEFNACPPQAGHDYDTLLQSDANMIDDPLIASDKKPRLIRSNSYTIENPSPILLAHLEKNKNVTTSETSFLKGKNLFAANVDTPLKLDLNDTSPESLYTTPLSDKECLETGLEVHQTDVIIQQITVHADANNLLFDNISPIKKQNQGPIVSSLIDETECQLLQILKDIPDSYSKQIMELIQKQKMEQQRCMDGYEYIKRQLLNDDKIPNGVIKDIPVNNLSFMGSTQLKVHKEAEQTDSQVTTPSDFYTLSNTSTTINLPGSPSVKLYDLEDDDNSEATMLEIHNHNRMLHNVSRELFPKDPVDEKKKRENKAASIIGAHVKGYLTRRLLKTDKVRGLIDTIKDTLLCALQLHNADTIDEYDIELHRRLVQQVSAACYAFHDVFFALSVQAQMMLISTDRQYKIEKAKRPSTGRKSTASNRRSSISSRKSSSSSRISNGTKA